jgi:hypothetical protein
MKSKLVPALVGGASIFLISILLSLIPRVGYCTCLLAILGGVIAAYLYIRNSPSPVSNGEGIIVGAMAGAITGVLRLAYVAIVYLLSRESFERLVESTHERLRQAGITFDINLHLIILAGGILAVVLLVVIEALGGMIGVALFEKRRGEKSSAASNDA